MHESLHSLMSSLTEPGWMWCEVQPCPLSLSLSYTRLSSPTISC